MNNKSSLKRTAVNKPVPSINPATGKKIGLVPVTDLSKMAEMMKQARKAQSEWSLLSYRQRKEHIRKIRNYILKNPDEIATVISESSGKTRVDAMATEVIPAALSAEWYSQNAEKILKREKLPVASVLFFNKRNVIERYPLRVVGIISPWNYPLSIPFGEVVMGLMAGNAVMLKVSTSTTMVGVEIDKIIKYGDLPDGLFRLLVGPGDRIVDALIENNADKIFFTGSTETGREIMTKASRRLIPVSLELGGKDAMIVLPDADLERASNGAAWAGYQNAGQSCGSVERLYVHDTVYDKMLELLSKKTKALRFGEDRDFNVDIGSMTTGEQWEKVEMQVNDALKKGAKISAVSSRGVKKRGSFYPPILMYDVNHGMDIMKNETFGPVVPVMKFNTIDEAVKLANDSTMGLTASVWTRNIKKGIELARRIEAGVVTINDHLYTHGQPETPWSGWKKSGIGFTHSKLGLLEMTRAKLINWDIIRSRRNMWWFPYDRNVYEKLRLSLKLALPLSVTDYLKGAFNVPFFLIKKMFSSWKT
ncbi:MAG: aldehyde dehydrogenase family protein [Spirochaetes bacterium]|nr:aldehyde dehydrogenase family protein [Spirochaetota bacterium]